MSSQMPPDPALNLTFTRADIVPVLLAGGEGKRLWPLSRRSRPKPFLKLGREHSFLQKTIARTHGMAPPLIVASADHRDIIITQLHEMDESLDFPYEIAKKTELILEPCGRNTAPAIAAAAHWVSHTAEETPILVMPSDHIIRDEENFAAAIDRALPLLSEDIIMTFGITPRYAATGYGYIQKGKMINGALGERHIYAADNFHEKPDKSRAAFYLKHDHYLWNSGIFLARAGVFLDALKLYAPHLSNNTYAALSSAHRYTNSIYLDESKYSENKAVSFDNAVLERTGNIAVVETDMRWRDVGTWHSLLLHLLGI